MGLVLWILYMKGASVTSYCFTVIQKGPTRPLTESLTSSLFSAVSRMMRSQSLTGLTPKK